MLIIGQLSPAVIVFVKQEISFPIEALKRSPAKTQKPKKRAQFHHCNFKVAQA